MKLLIFFERIRNFLRLCVDWILLFWKKEYEFYFDRYGITYLLNPVEKPTDQILRAIFVEKKDYVALFNEKDNIIGALRSNNKFKNSFLIIFDQMGREHFFCHCIQKGFEEISFHKAIQPKNLKGHSKDACTNEFYVLERVT